MKMLRFATALATALLLVAAPASAQWQTPNHSVPIGKGGGVTGFNNAAPGAAGKPFVSTGSTTDPAFGNIANSGFAPGAANTVKGSLDGTTVVDLPIPDCPATSTALRWAAGVGASCGNVFVQTGMDMPINMGLSASAAGGALTINLTTNTGGTPSAGSPVLVPFRSTTITTGTTVWRTIAAPLSITVPSGATLGTTSTVPFRVWVFLDDNAGTPSLGVATCSSPTAVFSCSSWEGSLKTSVTINAGATSGGTLYSPVGVTLDAVRIVGYCEYSDGLAAAGTWATSCTALQVFGPGIKKPGEVVQTVLNTSSSSLGIATTPGTAILTQAVTPQSKVNLFEITGTLGVNGVTSSSAVTIFLSRNTSTPLVSGSLFFVNVVAAFTVPATMVALDMPASATSVTYAVWGVATASTSISNGTKLIKISEIQG